MNNKLFPCALLACCAIILTSTSASAQTSIDNQRPVTTLSKFNGDTTLVNDFQVISEASPTAIKAAERSMLSSTLPAAATLRFNQMLMGAISSRLGSPYVWGATGPYVFDCSGFVWSSFREIGINFTRMSARNLWNLFPAPREEEKLKFGTLVFFSGLTHIGIVADENGFYHASRHHGVVYAPFNDYWLKRIDGFRRVPLPTTPALAE
ncbi:MAG TPA: C40 family peptidase [Pyrinomonadaceae bacterium]|jgi:cell wall-associated NlpC family hydrolase